MNLYFKLELIKVVFRFSPTFFLGPSPVEYTNKKTRSVNHPFICVPVYPNWQHAGPVFLWEREDPCDSCFPQGIEKSTREGTGDCRWVRWGSSKTPMSYSYSDHDLLKLFSNWDNRFPGSYWQSFFWQESRSYQSWDGKSVRARSEGKLT